MASVSQSNASSKISFKVFGSMAKEGFFLMGEIRWVVLCSSSVSEVKGTDETSPDNEVSCSFSIKDSSLDCMVVTGCQICVAAALVLSPSSPWLSYSVDSFLRRSATILMGVDGMIGS